MGNLKLTNKLLFLLIFLFGVHFIYTLNKDHFFSAGDGTVNESSLIYKVVFVDDLYSEIYLRNFSNFNVEIVDSRRAVSDNGNSGYEYIIQMNKKDESSFDQKVSDESYNSLVEKLEDYQNK